MPLLKKKVKFAKKERISEGWVDLHPDHGAPSDDSAIEEDNPGALNQPTPKPPGPIARLFGWASSVPGTVAEYIPIAKEYVGKLLSTSGTGTVVARASETKPK